MRVFVREGEVFRQVGCGVVWRAPEAAPAAREQLEVPLASGAGGRVRLVVENGDALPLPVTGAGLAWSPEEVVFRAAAAGAHRALAGAPGTGRPAYDLAAVLARSPGAVPGRRASVRSRRRTPATRRLPTPGHSRNVIERPLAAALAALVAVLGAWAVRLLRSAS